MAMESEKLSILMVEDNEDDVLIAQRAFREFKVISGVSVARDGQEALDAVGRECPDLLLLDVMMPRKNGFEVCQALRADERFAALKILMLTAKGRDTDVAKGQALGADAYMTKPFATRELVQKIADMLEGNA